MKSRIARIQLAMAAHGIHTLFVCHPRHVYYLSGFYTIARPLLQIGQTCCLISSDGTYELYLPAPWSDQTPTVSGCIIKEYTQGLDSLASLISNALPTDRRKKVAADLDHMSFPLAKALFAKTGDMKILDEHPILAKCRMTKDVQELLYLHKAVSLVDQGLMTAHKNIHAGKTELEIQASINAHMKLCGSEECGFTTKVISGENGSYPHHLPSNRRLLSSDAIIVDLSATVHGYESDSARTYLLEDASPQARSIHKAITELVQELPSLLKPGTPVSELCTSIKNHLASIGSYGIQAQTIGHGVGLFAHEYPDITASSTEILELGMVLAIEPALYFPGDFGIRIENMFTIGPEGGQKMNHFPLIHTTKETLHGSI